MSLAAVVLRVPWYRCVALMLFASIRPPIHRFAQRCFGNRTKVGGVQIGNRTKAGGVGIVASNIDGLVA